jgi:hypothetical protein
MVRFLSKLCILIYIAPCLLISQPKFTIVGGTRFDFGELYFGVAKRTLTIRNDGQDTLILSNVSASCGCTGTLMSNDHILPHDSGALSITFNTKNISGQAEKAVTLDTNDPDQKKIRIIFTANVTGVLDLQPEYLYYQTRLDSTVTQTVTIKNKGTSVLHLLSATSSADNISLKFSQTKIEPAEVATLTATLTPKAKGTFRANIEIKTDNPKLPVVDVRVVGLVTEKKTNGTSTH